MPLVRGWLESKQRYDTGSSTDNGKLGYLGITALSGQAQKLETMAKEGDLASAARALAELEGSISVVMPSIEKARLAAKKSTADLAASK